MGDIWEGMLAFAALLLLLYTLIRPHVAMPVNRPPDISKERHFLFVQINRAIP
jgi:hypothetical protein